MLRLAVTIIMCFTIFLNLEILELFVLVAKIKKLEKLLKLK